MKLPEIKIFYNGLIDPFFIAHNKHYEKNGWNKWVPPTKEEVLKKTEELRSLWKKDEETILTAMCDITNLNFKRNLIDVHIVSGSPRDISRPLIISAHNPKENFVASLTHELIHKLFSDNIENGVYKEIFKDLFSEETKTTQNHIILFAILKHIYLDVLKDKEKLKKLIEKSQNHTTDEYSRAWDILNKEGYQELIEKFKEKILSVQDR